nr:ORF2 [Torque teno felis virus]
MELPLPGPNLMLPTISLSGPPDLEHHLAYKRREAIWKALVSKTHKDWCLCGSYKNHFLPSDEPLRAQESSCTDAATNTEDIHVEGATLGGGDISDADIIAAAGDQQ